MCGEGQMKRRSLYAYRYAGLFVLCFLIVTGVFASPGQGGTSSPPGEAVQSAPPGAQGGPASPAQPQPFSLLDSLTVSPIQESRYATSGSAGTIPYHGLAASPTDKDFLADKPKSYLFSFDNGGNENRYIGLARIDRLDLMQVNRTSPNEYGAEFMIGYKVTSLGSIFFGKGLQLESPGDTSVRFQDDGWRFKFVKKFW
jgi:hypothetical protein